MFFDYWADWNWSGDFIYSAVLIAGVLVFMVRRGWQNESPTEKIFYAIILVSFVLRLGAGLIGTLTEWVPPKYYWDSATYQRIAVYITQGKPFNAPSEPVWNFAWLLSRLFLVLGFVPVTLSVICSLMGSLIVRNVYRTTEILGSSTAAAIVAGIWAVLPSNLFITSQPFRDPVVFLIVSFLVYWVVRIESGKEKRVIFLTVGAFAMSLSLCFFRPHQMIFVTGSLAFAALTTFVRSQKKSINSLYSMRGLGAVAILAFLLMDCGSLNGFDLINQYSQRMYSQLNSKRITYTNLVPFRRTSKETKNNQEDTPNNQEETSEIFGLKEKKGVRSGFVRDDIEEMGTLLMYVSTRDDTKLQFISRIPLRMLIFVLSPLPWQGNSFFLKIAIVENILLYIFMVMGFLSLPSLYRNHAGMGWFLLVYIFITVLAYGLVEGNVGTAYRHRMHIAWALFIPGAIQLAMRFRKKIS